MATTEPLTPSSVRPEIIISADNLPDLEAQSLLGEALASVSQIYGENVTVRSAPDEPGQPRFEFSETDIVDSNARGEAFEPLLPSEERLDILATTVAEARDNGNDKFADLLQAVLEREENEFAPLVDEIQPLPVQQALEPDFDAPSDTDEPAAKIARTQATVQPDYVAMLAAVDAQIEALQRRQIEAAQPGREANRASDNSLE